MATNSNSGGSGVRVNLDPTQIRGNESWSRKIARMLNFVDAPADIGIIGILAYILMQGKMGGAKDDIPSKGVIDEAGMLQLYVTLEKLGGLYGKECAKSIKTIHTALHAMDQTIAEYFRGMILAGLKKDEMTSFFQKLVSDMPTIGKDKQNRLKGYLLGHSDPRIGVCVDLHKELERIRYENDPPNVLSREKGAEVLIKKALEDGVIPKSLSLQGKEKVEKIKNELHSLVDVWTNSLEKRRSHDPMRLYWSKDEEEKSIHILTLLLIAVIVATLVVMLAKPEKYDRWDRKPTGTVQSLFQNK